VIRVGSALSGAESAKAAVEEAASAALAGWGAARPEAVLLFATPERARELPELLAAARDVLGTPRVVGVCASGVAAGGREQEGGCALALLAVAGLRAETFALPELAGIERGAGEEIRVRLGGNPAAEDLVLVLADPHALDPGPLLLGLEQELAPACVVGALASPGPRGAALGWSGPEVLSGGAVGMALRGGRPARVGVAQACVPVTEAWTVTRAEGHWVLELDGRPALDRFQEVAREPLASDPRRALAFLQVALPCRGTTTLEPPAYRVRNVVGLSKERRGFAVAEAVPRGGRLALALRDAARARAELVRMLEALGARPALLGLHLGSAARGASLFGIEGLESAYLESALGSTPLVGLHGSAQIAPLGGALELLTYSTVLALLDGDR
jgi:small ligand-binding sensory domain FIST